MFEGDSANACGEKFPLVSMRCWAEGLPCADLGARTPIGASTNSIWWTLQRNSDDMRTTPVITDYSNVAKLSIFPSSVLPVNECFTAWGGVCCIVWHSTHMFSGSFGECCIMYTKLIWFFLVLYNVYHVHKTILYHVAMVYHGNKTVVSNVVSCTQNSVVQCCIMYTKLCFF
jgi:hypothetical protein